MGRPRIWQTMNRIPPCTRSLILDMDGVLWRADAPIGNLPAIFERIRARGLTVAFATNNGTKTPEQYVARLARFGVNAEPWQVLTSSLVIADLLGRRLPAGGPVFAIGEEGLMTALMEKGFKPLSPDEAEKAQAVIIGVDRQINFRKMCEAALLVGQGIRSTQPIPINPFQPLEA